MATWSLRLRPVCRRLPRVAHQLGQARFDVQVHVFEVQLPFKRARFDFLCDLRHAALDGGMVLRTDHALRGQHLGVGQAACNVGLPQALVEEHAGGVALDQIAHGFREQRRPGLGLGVEVGCGMADAALLAWLEDMGGQ